MSNLDERIRAALASSEDELEDLEKELTVFETLRETFRGRQKWLVFGVYAATTIMAALMFYTGYRFFTAASTDDRLFFGIVMLGCMVSVIGKKTWYCMEMNRVTLSLELKRMELQLARLNESCHERDSAE